VSNQGWTRCKGFKRGFRGVADVRGAAGICQSGVYQVLGEEGACVAKDLVKELTGGVAEIRVLYVAEV
jgi:hypothetical protein